MKRVVRLLLLVVVLLVIAEAGASFYMLNFSLTPLRRSRSEALERLAKRCPHTRVWVDSIVDNGMLRDTIITLSDGSERHGYFMGAQPATSRTAVLVHGYKDCALSTLHLGCMYHRDMGYNIVLPDLWSHGESPGDYIGMGWNERCEVIEWARMAGHKWGGDSAIVILHGVSMGAATVMNVGAEPLPSCVKAIVEDCGYTSAWDELAGQLSEQFSLPAFPLMYTTSALCKFKCGWSFSENSPLSRVAHCKVPMMFIHGDNDDFVPTAMVHELCAAHPGPKRLWLAPGSAHARAYSDHPQEYTTQVKLFINQHIK